MIDTVDGVADDAATSLTTSFSDSTSAASVASRVAACKDERSGDERTQKLGPVVEATSQIVDSVGEQEWSFAFGSQPMLQAGHRLNNSSILSMSLFKR